MVERRDGFIEMLLSVMNADANGVEAVNNSENRVKEFVDHVPSGFFVYRADESEKILYANRSIIALYNCRSFEEFMAHTGGTFRGMVHPDDLNGIEESIAKQIKANRDDFDYVEYRIVCKDGTLKYVEDYGHLAHTELAGNVFYVFITDATDKVFHRVEDKLQRLEIIEGLAIDYESILYFDLTNDTVLPYRLSSRMKKHFDGILQVRKYHEMIENYIESWVHPDDKASVLEKLTPEYMYKRLSDGPTYYFNYRVIQDSKIKHLQLRISNVSKKKKVDKFVLGFKRVDEEIMQEIKKKQVLEDALKAAELADIAKATFLSNMSHDMRTPLNAVFGFITLARKNISDPEAVKYYLDSIEQAGGQMLDLTAKVLELSDARTQDLLVKETECDISTILNQVYEATVNRARKNNLQITLNTDGVEHCQVLTDGVKLKRILQHLTENAVQFNKKGGKIEIIVTEKANSDNAIKAFSFTVKDTGIGISPEAIERIFAPFEREKNTTASGIIGVGLGLTIAKRDAELLGGSIAVESVKDVGSTFTLTLNLKVTEISDKSQDKIQTVDLSGLKVLLVEDNETNLEIETDILTDEGFIVDTAENGQIAVDKIKNSPPDTYDVVLMDIQMPVMDGRQASSEIRLLDGIRAQIPVIALSANALDRDKKLSIEHGMNAHLEKPMDVEQIKKTIAEILSSRKS